jgi:ribose/xylose/arabinose/galactoside ABC-type transport system permease subunit
VSGEQAARPRDFARWATQLGLAVVILLLIGLFARLNPTYLSPSTISLVFRYYSPIAVLALGMTFVILTGGIDLSVGFLMMFLMFVMAGLTNKAGWDPGAAMGVGLVAAAAIGLFVGLCVSVFRIPAFIITLAVMVAAYGGTLLISGNQAITNLPAALEWLGGGSFTVAGERFPLTLPAVVLLFVVAGVVLRKTAYGRHLYAIGSNREAARLNGVRVHAVEASAYVVMACCCWLAALMQLGLNHTADPKVALSDSLELNAIAMVVIGGTSLTGGRGGVGGTALGALLLAILFNGLPALGGAFGETSVRKLVQAGVIFLGAVLDAAQRRVWRA